MCYEKNICECENREIISTWTSEELKKALDKGYKIKEIYEVLNYKNTSKSFLNNSVDDQLFKKYVNMWLKIKQQSSGWPSWCINEQDKNRYIEEYKNNEGIELEYEKIEKNEALRFIAKIMLNSFWGKLAQRPNQTKTAIINTYDEYWKLITDYRKEITGEFMVNEDSLIMSYQWKDDNDDNPKNYNIAVASYVTAWARLKLYELMEKIEILQPFSLLYFDTDSVFYVRKLSDPPILCGDYLGNLTDEIQKSYGKEAKCIEFVSLGPKNYGYVVKKSDNEKVSEYKCKDIS